MSDRVLVAVFSDDKSNTVKLTITKVAAHVDSAAAAEAIEKIIGTGLLITDEKTPITKCADAYFVEVSEEEIEWN